MMRRYPLSSSPQELASYVALEGSVIPEEICIERAKSIASTRSKSLSATLASVRTPTSELSWGWVLGWVLGSAALWAFPLLTPFLTILIATATATSGLLGASLQLRPILAALNPRSAVSWFGPFVSQKVEIHWDPVDLRSENKIAHDEYLHQLEYEHAPVGEGEVSPVRAETKAFVHVGGSLLDKPGELRALDALNGLSLEMRGQLFRGRRDLFQDLARKLLPDVFVQASTIAVATVVAALAISSGGGQVVRSGPMTLTWAAQFGLGIMVGRSVASFWNTLSWWGVARQNWEQRALEERLVIAAVAGVPDRVLSALAKNGRPIGGGFATPEEYARQRDATSALGRPRSSNT